MRNANLTNKRTHNQNLYLRGRRYKQVLEKNRGEKLVTDERMRSETSVRSDRQPASVVLTSDNLPSRNRGSHLIIETIYFCGRNPSLQNKQFLSQFTMESRLVTPNYYLKKNKWQGEKKKRKDTVLQNFNQTNECRFTWPQNTDPTKSTAQLNEPAWTVVNHVERTWRKEMPSRLEGVSGILIKRGFQTAHPLARAISHAGCAVSALNFWLAMVYRTTNLRHNQHL
jgi:hypothetical protein